MVRRMTVTVRVTVGSTREFDEIIDVRSPGEFEEDHIPGAGEGSWGLHPWSRSPVLWLLEAI